MANLKHLAKLSKGVNDWSWNTGRKENRDILFERYSIAPTSGARYTTKRIGFQERGERKLCFLGSGQAELPKY